MFYFCFSIFRFLFTPPSPHHVHVLVFICHIIVFVMKKSMCCIFLSLSGSGRQRPPGPPRPPAPPPPTLPLTLSVLLMLLFPLLRRSKSRYAQVTAQTSSALSSCLTPTTRRSSPAPETGSSTTRTRRRVPSTTDSVSSPAITGRRTRWGPQVARTFSPLTCCCFQRRPLCSVRLWRYQTTPTRSCHVAKTARCDGLTSAPKPAALKKTAKTYGDVLKTLGDGCCVRKENGLDRLCLSCFDRTSWSTVEERQPPYPSPLSCPTTWRWAAPTAPFASTTDACWAPEQRVTRLHRRCTDHSAHPGQRALCPPQGTTWAEGRRACAWGSCRLTCPTNRAEWRLCATARTARRCWSATPPITSTCSIPETTRPESWRVPQRRGGRRWGRRGRRRRSDPSCFLSFHHTGIFFPAALDCVPISYRCCRTVFVSFYLRKQLK